MTIAGTEESTARRGVRYERLPAAARELPPVPGGMNALVIGVANDRSIAWGCARAMRLAGAGIAMTYLNDDLSERQGIAPCRKTGARGRLSRVADRAPARRLVTIEEVGAACVFLACPYGAAMTGETLYVDGGYHILG